MQGHIALGVFISLASFCVQRSIAAPDDLCERLLSIGSVLKSGDERYRAVEVRAHGRVFHSSRVAASHFVAHAMFREPDRYSMCVFDGSTGDPILYSTNRGCILYDAIRNELLCAADSFVQLTVESKDGKIALEFQCGRSSVQRSQILVDIPSKFRGREDGINADALGAGKYQLGYRSDDGQASVAAFIDTSKAVPFTRVEYYGPNSRIEPTIFVDRMNANIDIEDRNFSFPDRQALDSSFRVVDAAFDEAFWREIGSPIFSRVLLARSLAKSPELRSETDFGAVKDLDVQAFRRRDSETSDKLRKLFDWPMVGLKGGPRGDSQGRTVGPGSK